MSKSKLEIKYFYEMQIVRIDNQQERFLNLFKKNPQRLNAQLQIFSFKKFEEVIVRTL